MNIRSGTKLLYELKAGETWKIFKNQIIILHPERQPKIIHSDGTVEVINADTFINDSD